MKGHKWGICPKCGKIHIHPRGMLNKMPWNKGLTKEMDNRLKELGLKISIANKGNEKLRKFGKNNPMYGKHRKMSEETKRKIAISKLGEKNPAKRLEVKERIRKAILRQIKEKGHPRKGKHLSIEAITKIKLHHWSKRGFKPWNKGVKQWENRQHPFLGKHHNLITRKKLSQIRKKFLENPEFKEKSVINALKGLIKRPTSFEKKIIELIEENNLPFEYVGDGKLLVCFRNPDFVHNNGKKLLIETYFSFWHPKNYEELRSKIFTKYGYKTLFLNEKDLLSKNWKDICLKKIKDFIGDTHSS